MLTNRLRTNKRMVVASSVTLFSSMLIHAPKANAIVFAADFHNGTNAAVQGGSFVTYNTGTGDLNATNPAPQVFGAITLDLNTINTRDRNIPSSTSPAGFERLLEDAVFAPVNGVVVTLDGLAAGRYRVTTFHHDPNSGGWGVGISVNDAVATNERRAANTTATVGTGPNVVFRTLTFDFVADGSGDSFTVLPISGSGAGWVNGFSIEAAPATPTISANVGPANVKLVSGWDVHIVPNASDTDGSAPTSRHFIADFASNPNGTIQSTLSSTAGNFLNARVGRLGNTDLLESFMFAGSGDLELLLSGLSAGEYELTTFHFDPGNASTTIGLTGSTQITVDLLNDGFNDLFDTDANGSNDASLLQFTGTALNPSTTFRFTLAADGNVAVNFAGNDLLNAYRLTQVAAPAAAIPEPTIATLGLLSMSGLLMRRHRLA